MNTSAVVFPNSRLSFKVAFSRVAEKQLHSVVAVFEDRYNLWGLDSASGNLVRRRLPARRAADMGKLSGFRSTLCLLLEAMDVILPVVKTLGEKMSATLSFLFVNLIGRRVLSVLAVLGHIM